MMSMSSFYFSAPLVEAQPAEATVPPSQLLENSLQDCTVIQSVHPLPSPHAAVTPPLLNVVDVKRERDWNAGNQNIKQSLVVLNDFASIIIVFIFHFRISTPVRCVSVHCQGVAGEALCHYETKSACG